MTECARSVIYEVGIVIVKLSFCVFRWNNIIKYWEISGKELFVHLRCFNDGLEAVD